MILTKYDKEYIENINDEELVIKFTVGIYCSIVVGRDRINALAMIVHKFICFSSSDASHCLRRDLACSNISS